MKTFTITVAGLAALAQAVEFTNDNFDIVPGQDFELTWAGAEGPVTIKLRRGPRGDLQDVEDITAGQDGNSFTWSVPSDQPEGEDYALEISDGSDGEDSTNYSPQFKLSGGEPEEESAASTSEEEVVSVTSTSEVVVESSTSATTSSIVVISESSAEPESTSVVESVSSEMESSASVSASASDSDSPRPTGAADDEDEDEDPAEVPDSKAGTLGSPMALIGTVAALLYLL